MIIDVVLSCPYTCDRFAINSTTGRISTKDTVDRETEDSYTVTITATDQDPDEDARRAQSVPATIIGTALIVVSDTAICHLHLLHCTVLDINDNGPQFSEDMYEFSIPENTATVELTITASDEDEGTNGEIVYEFINGTTNSAFLIGELCHNYMISVLSIIIYILIRPRLWNSD